MFQIVEKKKLNDAVVMVRIAAPLIAKKVLPGQFIIFRLDEFGERVPLTVADYDREGGTIIRTNISRYGYRQERRVPASCTVRESSRSALSRIV